MNTNDHMLIIKGRIKTLEVQSCHYNPATKMWDIAYRTGKTYSYAYHNVVHLKNPERLDPKLYQIRKEGKLLTGIRQLSVFHGTDQDY